MRSISVLIPRSPLFLKAFLIVVAARVQLRMRANRPGKRYFLASPTAGNSNPVFCVGSGAGCY